MLRVKDWNLNIYCNITIFITIHRFWSNIVYDTGCMESLISFLQEASPFYLPFKHESKQVTEAYVTAYKRVLQIFCRIITNKENEVDIIQSK